MWCQSVFPFRDLQGDVNLVGWGWGEELSNPAKLLLWQNPLLLLQRNLHQEIYKIGRHEPRVI